VGGNLVRRLLKEKYPVRVLQYHDSEAFQNLNVEIYKGDLANFGILKEFCQDVDLIYHLAAKITVGYDKYEDIFKTNVEGTKNLVMAAKECGVKRFIHFSSIHALDHHPLDQPMDESRPLATDSKVAYEKTKALADEWILSQQSDNFDVIVLNPSAIIGPFDFKPSLMSQFIIQAYSGSLPGLVAGGYDWVDVRDVCDAAFHALDHGKGGERFIINGTWKSVVDFVKIMEEVSGKKLKKTVIPLWLAHIGVPFIYIWSKLTKQHPLYTSQTLAILQEGNRNILHKKAEKELNYHPRPLEETLRDTLNWLKENNFIKA